MRNMWKRAAVLALAAAAAIPVWGAVRAEAPKQVYVDGGAKVTKGVTGYALTGSQGSAQFTQYSDPQEVVANGTEILIPMTKMAEYKSFFEATGPKEFPMKGQGVVKAEVKYSIEPADPSLADQIQVNTMLVAQHESQNAEGKYQTTFCQKAVPNAAPVSGEVHTATYYMDGAQGQIHGFVDGNYQKSWASELLKTEDLTWVKLYLHAIVPGGSDGESMLATPLTWHVSYFTVEEIPAASAAVRDLSDGASGVAVDRAFELDFNMPMDPATLTADTVLLEVETAGGYAPAAAEVTPTESGCTLRAAGNMDYTTNYRISLTDGIRCQKMSIGAAAGPVLHFKTQARELADTVFFQDTPVSLTVNGRPAPALSGGTVACTARLTGRAGQTVQVTAAVYERTENGSRYLESVSARQAVDGDTQVVCGGIAVPPGDQYFIRVFVWDQAGRPMTDTVLCPMGGTPAFEK